MSAMSLALLLAAAAATALGAAALHAAHGLRHQLSALRAEVASLSRVTGAAATVPGARATPAAEIRAAVADALAEERERELAEARAFWAAQEARDAADAPSLLGGAAGFGEETTVFVPRQADLAGLEPSLGHLDPFDRLDAVSLDSLDAVSLDSTPLDAVSLDSAPVEGAPADGAVRPEAPHPGAVTGDGAAEAPAGVEESAELAAARRRHPSHPDFSPAPAVGGPDRTAARLEELSEARVPLADVRPGPLGTLDVYVFADGTTLCMTPGHRQTAERLAGALREGEPPVLLGGSAVAGAYALTFTCGEETVYVLADRVIASI
ncbi:hypothetical protein [Streptomyces sp. URMC 123]|uniref:hypothetical protein n=1 Tax=Streptomyces sp. URMC 123 TaxID=3423403 RepID=UPI003F1C626D